ncbi:dihydroneopterin aldolase [Oceanicella actignis]|uniref:dihydroneopterin aldolase n=1 Tax=Oceanicella actignis TaxID=1189325 RepID=UPI0011E7610C|nr:dihydroneopterin aldolase [Oceanicella actignis]TYO84976.1 dihydroneopterin aldolase [Oceanicella actignis]
MIDETALAFEWPRRDTDTAELPLDRISVRDLVRAVEIGAFASERGVAQRLRFSVVLEVRPTEAGATDDVDRVISYDTLVEAIDDTLAEGRLNLLETCAERIAARCLRDPRAARVLVRVEKLDRIPGALGVEIVRTRRAAQARLAQIAATAAGASPMVAALTDPALLDDDDAARRAAREALAARRRPVAAVVAPGRFGQAAVEAARRMGLEGAAAERLLLSALDQAAWAFAGQDARFVVTDTRTELVHALRSGRPAVWAPARILCDLKDEHRPDPRDAPALARFLAAHLGAGACAVIGADGG